MPHVYRHHHDCPDYRKLWIKMFGLRSFTAYSYKLNFKKEGSKDIRFWLQKVHKQDEHT